MYTIEMRNWTGNKTNEMGLPYRGPAVVDADGKIVAGPYLAHAQVSVCEADEQALKKGWTHEFEVYVDGTLNRRGYL